jgi:hypothetical protein
MIWIKASDSGTRSGLELLDVLKPRVQERLNKCVVVRAEHDRLTCRFHRRLASYVGIADVLDVAVHARDSRKGALQKGRVGVWPHCESRVQGACTNVGVFGVRYRFQCLDTLGAA